MSHRRTERPAPSDAFAPLSEVGEILARGYFRYRRKLAAGETQKEALSAEKTLDDVTPRGRVGTGEGRTPETGGDA